VTDRCLVDGGGATDKAEVKLSIQDARIKAMSHPVRRKILRHIVEHGPIAPVEIHHDLRIDMSKSSYHCRVLIELGCAEVVRTEPIRGSMKHWLIATERPLVEDPEWEELDPVVREGILAAVMQSAIDDFKCGAGDGTIGQTADDFHMTRVPLRALDAEGFAELRDAHQRLFEETSEIARRAAERMSKSRETPIAVSSSQLCFRVESFSSGDR
jgi:hypothetical protein